MTTTLPGWRDRAGHSFACALLAVFGCLLLPQIAAAGPGGYKAQRFDVIVTPEGGTLDVRETVTFEFQSGTFRKVWREIPSARTDGIDVIEARMDGTAMPRGDGPGHIAVTGRNRIKVEWNFAEKGPSVHTFELHYRARGVVYREGGSDVLRWRALPAEHRYAIDASRITVASAGAQVRPAETRRIESVSVSTESPGVVIEASGIRSNGSLIVDLRYPAGALIPALPAWQQRGQYAAALGPRWLAAAGTMLAVGILLILVLRQGYTAPSMLADETTTTSPPDQLPAALAAVLAANGRMSGYQPIATLLDLAERGALTVRELPRTLGVRNYELSQVPGTHDLADHETEALTIAFAGRADPVTLSKARGRLTRSARRFAAAVNADLSARGLIDPSRKAVRDRLTTAAIVMLIAAAAGTIVTATLIPRFEAWPFLLPLGLAIAGIVGIIVAASTTPLSDRGLMEAARWRGFKRYLKTLAGAKEDRGGVDITPRWIVYGIAVGLATQWSRYLKAHPAAAPSWFVAAAHDDGGAFAVFVGSQAATSGHGGGGGGGAAGGGGSGAG